MDPIIEKMDRLTRMIARLATQRACLDFAAGEIEPLAGCVLEVGLGKGRTYDRLRLLFPQRDIYVFDRFVHCSDDVRPPDENLFLGDVRDTLPDAAQRIGNTAALVHADIGTTNYNKDGVVAAVIAPLLAPLLAPGGLVLSDRELSQAQWETIPLPKSADGYPYYIYRG